MAITSLTPLLQKTAPVTNPPRTAPKDAGPETVKRTKERGTDSNQVKIILPHMEIISNLSYKGRSTPSLATAPNIGTVRCTYSVVW